MTSYAHFCIVLREALSPGRLLRCLLARILLPVLPKVKSKTVLMKNQSSVAVLLRI